MWMYRLKNVVPDVRDARIEFKTKIPKNLECANCSCVPSVLWRAVCTHGFCNDCKNLLETDGMLVCSGDFSETDVDELDEDDSVSSIIEDFVVSCLWSPSGCQFSGPLKELGDHLNCCQFHRMECPKCKAKVEKRLFESHVKYCKASVKNLTPAPRTPRLPVNGNSSKNTRPAQKIPCSLHQAGCQYQGTNEDLSRHETFQNHIRLLLNFAQSTNDAIAKLQENEAVLKEEKDRLAHNLNVAQEEIQKLKKKDEETRKTIIDLQYNVLKNHERLFPEGYYPNQMDFTDPAPRGFYLWRIPGYNEIKMKAASGEEDVLYGKPFYSAIPGYRLRMIIYPNGCSSVSKNHFSVFFQILKGRYDHLVPWPFREKVRLRISDQSGNGKHKDYISTISTSTSAEKPENRKPFQKPKTENNVPTGSARMLLLKDLENPSNGFLRNDTIEVIFELI